jgi:ABC-type branched-subunit amino acid transport system permease subunit
LIVLSLATVLVVQEIANKMTWLTGGADGLQGIAMRPVLGQFTFDLYGRVSYTYAAIVLALGFLVFRSVVDSNFGKSLVGIRENEARMHALGTPVDARLRTAFVMSAALAGIAGALQAQVAEFVALNALSVEFSGEIPIVLILGAPDAGTAPFLARHCTFSCRTTSRGRIRRTGISGSARSLAAWQGSVHDAIPRTVAPSHPGPATYRVLFRCVRFRATRRYNPMR